MVIFGFCFQRTNDSDDLEIMKHIGIILPRLSVSKYVNSLSSIIFYMNNICLTNGLVMLFLEIKSSFIFLLLKLNKVDVVLEKITVVKDLEEYN